MSFFRESNISFYARFYYALRIHLHKSRRLLRLAQILHAHVLLGPLRRPIVRYYQKFSNNKPLATNTYSIFPDMDLDQVVNIINKTGYAYIGNIPEEYIKQIVRYCEINKRTRHWNPHKNCEAVKHICYNNVIIEIVRRYLGVEPILWLSQLTWSFSLSDNPLDFHKSIYREPAKYDPHKFHYDITDFKSLTLFIYLTDVYSSSGAHVIVEGTHI